MRYLTWASLLLFSIFIMLIAIRLADWHADNAEWDKLTKLQPEELKVFDPTMVKELPEPVRRYFEYMILPGSHIYPVSVINMKGQFSLGTKDEPRYQEMEANQILAAPQGFVWSMHTLSGLPVSGSDSGKWTRFRIFGLVPVGRLGGDYDHTLSAFGRYVAEATIWSPAAVLPSPGVEWSAAGDNIARVTITHNQLTQTVDIKIDSDGRPYQVSFLRWSDANPEKVHKLQPFGAVLSDFREVSGYRLPFRVEAGNMFGTVDYFPFFVAEVRSISFPKTLPQK